MLELFTCPICKKVYPVTMQANEPVVLDTKMVIICMSCLHDVKRSIKKLNEPTVQIGPRQPLREA